MRIIAASLPLLLAAVPLLAADAAAPERIDRSIVSVCSFQTPEGEAASARFTIQHGEWTVDRGVAFIRVLSSLSVAGKTQPALAPECYAQRRGGLRCPHGEASGPRYELFPRIAGETDAVEAVRVLVWRGDEPVAVEGACSPAK